MLNILPTWKRSKENSVSPIFAATWWSTIEPKKKKKKEEKKKRKRNKDLGCVYSKWCLGCLHHFPESNQDWIHGKPLLVSKYPCKDVWVDFVMPIKPIEMSLAKLGDFSFLILCSSMFTVLEDNLITLLIFDLCRLLMSGKLKSD